jgi:hypothetical protein
MAFHSKKTYIDKKGYARFCDSNIPVHKWVAENKLGRKLRKGEVVHHKDRDKLNNSPDNLHVFENQTAHDNAHRYDAYRFGKAASYQGFRKKYKSENSGCLVTVFWILILAVTLASF